MGGWEGAMRSIGVRYGMPIMKKEGYISFNRMGSREKRGEGW